MSETGILPPLLERLACEGEAHSAQAFDHEALAESIRTELLRLLNSRRSARQLSAQPSILDYGIIDWTSLQGQRGDDRRQLAREIRATIGYFEPRLKLSEVEVLPQTMAPQQLRVRLSGVLRSGKQYWPVTFVIEQAGDGIKVRHE